MAAAKRPLNSRRIRDLIFGLCPVAPSCSATRRPLLRGLRHRLCAALLVGIGLLATSPCRSGELLWPLPIAPALSSSFGESRSTSFHMGIDLKTWGRTGYEVRALSDGYIERVRTSPWGYGRAVYQRLADGRIAVYAHLQRFGEQTAKRVDTAQLSKMRYSVDLWFKEGEIAVKKGEIIAYSGQSGAGPPHLHLELRDADNIPLNPLLGDFVVEDTTAPIIRRLGLVPFGRESRVGGGSAPLAVTLRWDAEKQVFTTSRQVQVHGRIGIGAQVWDRADAAPNKLAPHRLMLRVDGQEVFAASYDRVSYANGRQVNLDRMYIDFSGGRGRFHNLFRLPGNRLGFYSTSTDGFLRSASGQGVAFLAEGSHDIEVVALDAFGNSSTAQLALMVNAPPRLLSAGIVESGGTRLLEWAVQDGDDALLRAELLRAAKAGTWQRVDEREVAAGSGLLRWPLNGQASLWKLIVRDSKGGADSVICALPGASPAALARMQVERIAHADWVELVLHFTQPLAALPQVRVGPRELVARQVGLGDYVVGVPLAVAGGDKATVVVEVGNRRRRIELAQRAVRPGQAKQLRFAEDAVELDFAENSVYELVFPQVDFFEPEVPKGLIAAGPGYVIGPDVRLGAGVGVRLRYDVQGPPLDKLGLYEEVAEGKWAMVGNELEGEWVGASVRKLGRFALLADVVVPIVEKLRPQAGAKTKERRPLLRAYIADVGSGIGREEDIAIELDGRPLVAEYDPEAGQVQARPRADLKPGQHEWRVWVRDMSGNEREVRAVFRVL